MGVDYSQFDELRQDLIRMANELENGTGLDKALKEGAKPIYDDMKRRTKIDPKERSGKLHKAIKKSGVKKRRDGGKRVTIGVHKKEQSGGVYYSNPVEFGHGGPAPAPEHPFVRPAFDTQSKVAYTTMRDVMSKEIDTLFKGGKP